MNEWNGQSFLFFLFVCSLGMLLGKQIGTGIKEARDQKAKDKVLYFELCEDSGVPAFECFDGWMRIKYGD